MNNGWRSKVALQIVALFLAFVVWLFVSAPRRERVSERRFAAPLSLVGVPRELVVTTQVPDNVSVRLRGRESELRRISSQTLEVPVDLSWVQRAGEITVTLRPQAINVPPEIEVVTIDPNKFRFRVEPLRQRIVRIRPYLVGGLPQGYVAGEPTVHPEQALISGPLAHVRNVSEVATERIIMTGRTGTFTQTVAVVSDSPLVRVIEPLTAQVTVPVLPEVGPAPQPSGAAGTTTSAADDRNQP